MTDPTRPSREPLELVPTRSGLLRTLAVHLLESRLDVDETIETAAGAVIGTLADSCTVFLFEYGGFAVLRAARHRDPALEAAIDHLAEAYRPDSSAADGSPVAGALSGAEIRVDWRNTKPADELTRKAVEALKSKAWLALPLRDPDGEILGALRFSRGREEPAFDDADTAVARQISLMCGTAIARTQTAHADRMAVERLSRDLAPKALPEIPGLELQVRYHSGTSAVGVGGDWCDALHIGDRVVIAVGDAAGHGIGAAVTMNEVAGALRAFAFVESAGGVVRQLDRYVTSRRSAEMITACVVDLDPQSRKVRIANAGHMPPILATERTTKYLDKGRTVPLGSGKVSSRFRPAKLRLEPGDRLCLYTDGLVERRGEVIDIGIDRLVRTVVNAPADLSEACDYILDRMAPAGGFTDDVALFGMKLSPAV